MSVVTVSLPPLIAERDVVCPPELAARMEDSLREITSLDRTHGADLQALSSLLLRTESVASSKIEQVEASTDDYARALHGIRSNTSALSMAAATGALAALIRSVEGRTDMTLEEILAAHRALMLDEPPEHAYAGRLRDMQNWIGGSDHSPRNAAYVPPPSDTVKVYMADLIRFANRDDLQTLAQAAIAHAQFESIHPFTDGNGRIGRALVNTVLRRRGATSCVVVPIASALVARRDWYFDLLGAYRAGDPEPIIRGFTAGAALAAKESIRTAARLAAMPADWRDAVGPVRAGSATAKLLGRLHAAPVFSAEEAEDLVGGAAASAVYGALQRLTAAGILRPLTNRKRNQVWGVASVLAELDDLGTRIAAASRAQAPL